MCMNQDGTIKIVLRKIQKMYTYFIHENINVENHNSLRKSMQKHGDKKNGNEQRKIIYYMYN